MAPQKTKTICIILGHNYLLSLYLFSLRCYTFNTIYNYRFYHRTYNISTITVAH